MHLIERLFNFLHIMKNSFKEVGRHLSTTLPTKLIDPGARRFIRPCYDDDWQDVTDDYKFEEGIKSS